MKKLVLVLLATLFMLHGCSEATQEHSSSLHDSEDVIEEDVIEVPDIILWTPEPEPPLPECIECAMYFCPPLDAIWRKEICMNICDDPL